MLKALIFDVDGTLAETEEAHRLAFNDAFAALGLPDTWDKAQYHALHKITGGRERLIHYLGPGSERLAARLHAISVEAYCRRVAQGEVALRPGILPLIRAAQARGLRLAISTTSRRANVEALLVATLGAESLSWFEVLGTGECVTPKKPEPDIYLYVLENLCLPASECLAFEDSWNGLQAALGAGLEAVASPSLYTQGEDLSGARLVVESWEELTLDAILQG